MKFCHKCGNTVKPGERFCQYCGAGQDHSDAPSRFSWYTISILALSIFIVLGTAYLLYERLNFFTPGSEEKRETTEKSLDEMDRSEDPLDQGVHQAEDQGHDRQHLPAAIGIDTWHQLGGHVQSHPIDQPT